MSLLRKEEKLRKHNHSLSDWKEFCEEAVYRQYPRCENPYLSPRDQEYFKIAVS
jgi:hypothetical protein